jgi:hypothetical protein
MYYNCCSSSNVINLTLPTGTLTHAGMIGGAGSTLQVNQGFEWSIINTGTPVGVVTLTASTAHTIVGDGALDISKRTRLFSKHAIRY